MRFPFLVPLLVLCAAHTAGAADKKIKLPTANPAADSSALKAAGATGLSWDEAASEALQNNPGLIEARLYLKQGQEQVTIGDAAFFPTLNANANVMRGGGQTVFTNGDIIDNTPGTYAGSLTSAWNLFNGFNTLATRDENLAAVANRRAAYEQTSSALYQSLGQAFNQVIYDQANLALLRQLVDRYHQDTLYQEQEFKAGLTALWTYEKSQSDEAGEAWMLNQQQFSLLSDRSALAVLLGRPADTSDDLVVAGELTVTAAPADFRGDLDAMVGSNPTLAYYRTLAKEADAALWASESTRYPSVGLNGNIGKSGTKYLPPPTWQWGLTLNVSYQIFAGGGQEAAISQAQQALDEAKVTVGDQQHQLTAALYKAWTSYMSAYQRLPPAAMAVLAGVDRFDTVGQLYQAGREEFLDYEQAESIYSGAQTQQLSALLSAASAEIAYRNAIGLTLEKAAQYPAP